MTDPFKIYIQTLQADLARGNATEHTHRPALKTLLEALEPGVTATNEPKKYTDCGKPDMRVFRGLVPLGSLETKDIGKNLQAEEKTKQVKDYLQGLRNFILTDYLEFRWYVNGKWRATESLGHVEPDGRIKVKKEGLKAAGDLLAQFLAIKPPEIATAKELALRMAGLAHIIRGVASLTLEQEPENGKMAPLLQDYFTLINGGCGRTRITTWLKWRLSPPHG